MTSQWRYCPQCGSSLDTRKIEGRDRHYCSVCEIPLYRNPKPCAGTLVVDGNEVLLVQRTIPPAVGTWSVPAGYLELDEPPRTAATRELSEETGLSVSSSDLHLFKTTFVEHPDSSRVVVILYCVSRQKTSGDPLPGSDAGDAKFWSLQQISDHTIELEPGYHSIFNQAIAEFE